MSASERQAAAKLFPDVNRLGDGEPPLEGIAFEIVEQRTVPELPRHHRRSTDASGEWTICFDYPARVSVHEVGHAAGGWSLTTRLPDPIDLQCSTTTTLTVGNGRLGLPKTGHARMRTMGGRFGMAAGTALGWVPRN